MFKIFLVMAISVLSATSFAYTCPDFEGKYTCNTQGNLNIVQVGADFTVFTHSIDGMMYVFRADKVFEGHDHLVGNVGSYERTGQISSCTSSTVIYDAQRSLVKSDGSIDNTYLNGIRIQKMSDETYSFSKYSYSIGKNSNYKPIDITISCTRTN